MSDERDERFDTLKPGGTTVKIAEQIIEDGVSELTIQFAAYPGGGSRLSLTGPFPFGNRDIIFDADGVVCGSGAGMCTHPPSWLSEVKSEDAAAEETP